MITEVVVLADEQYLLYDAEGPASYYYAGP